MPEIGQTLSHFKILEKIGEGGMGEVYLADDTTLDRKVALKFLPEAFTSDPERMARFEREAKLLASLNHPNIAGIYGLEQADGNRFLILEYVEGETLQARLSKGALPLEDALELCRQIAEGLEAAHEKGVIHRDLKPANVMITAEEKVKILDFGLAKAFSDDTQSIDSSQSPTLTEAMTRPGVILGTAAYMSPEQAKGKSVDKRADIWAFGCILYECLTGKKAFEGETVTETLAAILRGEPDWNKLPPNLHPRISLLLERCLEKHTKDRYGVISDARVDIQKVLSDPSGVLVQPSAILGPKIKSKQMILWASVTIILLIVVSVVIWNLKIPEPRQIIRFDYELPDGLSFVQNLITSNLAISFDGSQFVYNTPNGLYLRSLNELTVQRISGTEGGIVWPFFSPDGKWIAYFTVSDLKLKKVFIAGGAPETICDIESIPLGASWLKNNMIVYSEGGKGIFRVSSNGGAPELIAKARAAALPQLLPDEVSILYTNYLTDASKIMIHSLESAETKELFPAGGAMYIPTGHIVYSIPNEGLYAVPFDLENLKVTGEAVRMVEGLQTASVSDNGTLIYIPSTGSLQVERTLVWVDREGKEEPLGVKPAAYNNLRISPDETRVALSIGDRGNEDIYILDFATNTLIKLTFDEADDAFPIWTPDNKRIVFASLRNNKCGIYSKAADNTGEVQEICSVAEGMIVPTSWSEDGKTLVLVKFGTGSNLFNVDILTVSMDGDKTIKPLLNEKHMETTPQISPDGRWIAYQSNESDHPEVYVRPFPNVNEGSKWQISTDYGTYPQWSRDGKELFYLSREAVMAVAVDTKPTFKNRTPVLLFKREFAILNSFNTNYTTYHFSGDGKRLLTIKQTDIPDEGSNTATTNKITVVINWFEELKEKVPVP